MSKLNVNQIVKWKQPILFENLIYKIRKYLGIFLIDPIRILTSCNKKLQTIKNNFFYIFNNYQKLCQRKTLSIFKELIWEFKKCINIYEFSVISNDLTLFNVFLKISSKLYITIISLLFLKLINTSLNLY